MNIDELKKEAERCIERLYDEAQELSFDAHSITESLSEANLISLIARATMLKESVANLRDTTKDFEYLDKDES